jgi:hypothetical protein
VVIIEAMPLLVTHRSRSCVAALDHQQKLYGTSLYDDQYPINMSNKYTDGDDMVERDFQQKDNKHVDGE